MKANFHTHCNYCDGKEPILNYIEEADRLCYDQLGFSSHAPVPFANDFGIHETQIPEYVRTIDGYQSQFPHLRLFKGLECDFVPGMTQPFAHYRDTYHLDFLIGGVHLVRPENDDRLWFIDGSKYEIYDNGLRELFGMDVRRAVTRFWEQSFEMIETQQFDIIAHCDKIKMHNRKRYFTEDEPWYRQLADHLIDLVRQKHLIVEINTRGIYKGRCPDFYPSDYILSQVARYHIPMIISTDAHKSEEVSLGYDDAVAKLKSFGISYLMYIKDQQWEEHAI